MAGVLVDCSSKAQAVIAQSSGEAELMGIRRGACFGIYMSNLWLEMTGEVAKIRVLSDSCAARAIAVRVDQAE